MQVELGEKLLAEQIVGTKISLRPYYESDKAALQSYRQDPEQCRYIRPPQSNADLDAFILQHSQGWQMVEGHWNGLVIIWNQQPEAIGDIAFKIEDWKNQRMEVGYRVSKHHAGQGVASEALTLLLNYLFERFSPHKIVAKCDPLNIASHKVMRKVGMCQEAHFKSHFLIGERWSDQLDFGISKAQWQHFN
ncbi:GNAT family N-acetyltransferase [Aliikangiella sp. IMCC44653]